ncbi:Ig-like domain-containing protein [Vibrio sp. S4M6]|uniref:Ig-like domain-containing protein n=1 Tax=Vibrio sinus TaxID=2946865 RepID=UPI00202A2722|nr:Ig-like domain-containing protein [Vibrio sinus]MCL9783613.1 Ig-like domain-containing protein [Vibrio sinus]
MKSSKYPLVFIFCLVLSSCKTDSSDSDTDSQHKASHYNDVVAISITQEKISDGATSPRLTRGLSEQLIATAVYRDNTTRDITKEVVWNSSDEKVLRVTDKGLVFGVNFGVGSIKATLPNGVYGTFKVNVVDLFIRSISVTEASSASGGKKFTIAKGLSQKLKATAIMSDNSMQDITNDALWRSTDPSVSVSNKGIIRAIKQSNEKVEITARLQGKKGSIAFIVTNAVLQSISIVEDNPILGVTKNQIAIGLSQNLKAIAHLSDGNTQDITTQAAWLSSDSSSISVSNKVSNKGLMHAVKNIGKPITITANFNGKSGSSIYTVAHAIVQTINITEKNPVNGVDENILAKGLRQQLVATANLSDGTTQDITAQASWVSSDASSLSVSPTGLIHALKNSRESITITATSNQVQGQRNYVVTDAIIQSISIIEDNPVLGVTDNEIALGLTQNLKAIANFSDDTTQDITAQAAWISSNPLFITVSSQGRMHALKAHDEPITITAVLNENRGSSRYTVVEAVIQSISITEKNPVNGVGDSTISKGLRQQLKATANFSDNTVQDITNEASWVSSDVSSLTVSPTGLIHALGESSQLTTITAKFDEREGSKAYTVTGAVIQSISIIEQNPLDGATEHTIAKGLRQQLKATANFSDETTQDITAQASWKSSNASSLSVSPTGRINALEVIGEPTVITAKFGNIEGAMSYTVVDAIVQSISITEQNSANNAQENTIAKGLRRQLKATAKLSDSTTQDITEQAVWTSSDASSLTVSPKGLIHAIEELGNSITITAVFAEAKGSTIYTVTDPFLTNLSLSLDESVVPAPSSSPVSVHFIAAAEFSDGTKEIVNDSATWSPNSPNGRIVNLKGSTGEHKVTASLNNKSGSFSLIKSDPVDIGGKDRAKLTIPKVYNGQPYHLLFFELWNWHWSPRITLPSNEEVEGDLVNDSIQLNDGTQILIRSDTIRFLYDTWLAVENIETHYKKIKIVRGSSILLKYDSSKSKWIILRHHGVKFGHDYF